MDQKSNKAGNDVFIVIDKRAKTREEIMHDIMQKKYENASMSTYQAIYEVALKKTMDIIVYLPFEITALFESDTVKDGSYTQHYQNNQEYEESSESEEIDNNLKNDINNNFENGGGISGICKELPDIPKIQTVKTPTITIVETRNNLSILFKKYKKSMKCVLSQELFLSSRALIYAFNKISNDKVTVLEPSIVYGDSIFNLSKNINSTGLALFNNVSIFDKIYLYNMLSNSKSSINYLNTFSMRNSVFLFYELGVNFDKFIQEIFIDAYSNLSKKHRQDKFELNNNMILYENADRLIIPDEGKRLCLWPEVLLDKKSTDLKFWDSFFADINVKPAKREIFLLISSIIRIFIFLNAIRFYNLYMLYFYLAYLFIIVIPVILKYDIIYPDYMSHIFNKKMKRMYHNTFTNFNWMALFIMYAFPLHSVTIALSCIMILTKRMLRKIV